LAGKTFKKLKDEVKKGEKDVWWSN
jgi:hypothetical protein